MRRGPRLIDELTALAYTFAVAVVRASVEGSMRRLMVWDDAPAPSEPAKRAPKPRGAELLTAIVPERRGRSIRTLDYVEPFIQLVHDMPWAPRARELRAILKVKKDPLLRIAKLALATGRVVRVGQKSGMTYLPAENGRALPRGYARMKASARPKARRSGWKANARR